MNSCKLVVVIDDDDYDDNAAAADDAAVQCSLVWFNRKGSR